MQTTTKVPTNGVEEVLEVAPFAHIPVQVMCVECRGEGYIEVQYTGGDGAFLDDLIPCGFCEGEGYIETPIPVQDFINYVAIRNVLAIIESQRAELEVAREVVETTRRLRQQKQVVSSEWEIAVDSAIATYDALCINREQDDSDE